MTMTNPESPHPYPLMENAPEALQTAGGRPLSDVTLEAAAAGELSPDDFRISANTLRAQAAIARDNGYPQLALNLTRAAELVAVPNDEMLAMYEQLRPGRASFSELQALADRLERVYDASHNASLVREAAHVYRARGMLRGD